VLGVNCVGKMVEENDGVISICILATESLWDRSRALTLILSSHPLASPLQLQMHVKSRTGGLR